MDQIESIIKPILSPVTQNLPKPIRDIGVNLLGNHCYKILVHDVQVTDTSCLKLAISKGLGVGIIGASAVVKIPQLLKLLNSQSAAGVSFLSYALETASYLISLAYNARQGFPFSTYGETAFIAVQNVAIAVLVLQYSGKGAVAIAWVAALVAAGYALFNAGIVDLNTLSYLQAGAGLLGVASKLPQIITIWREGGTGQLSAFAVFNYLVGSLTRIFTTLQEVDDKLILYGFIAGFVLNALLAAQMVYYWNSGTSKKTKTKPGHKVVKGGKQAVGVSSSGSATGASAKKAKSPSTRRRG
ncbi:hypothetical protein BDV97DRAFT_402128 [Delphinella strobiligena]|nr:hypothetical protein BDV97DRAFT_402128 [Delphinella strobiligena]